MKHALKSKTIVVNLAAIVLLQAAKKFWPGAEEAICGNSALIVEVLASINLALRLVTKEPVSVRGKRGGKARSRNNIGDPPPTT